MALSVLNNIASLAAQNQLTITNANLQKALFQLSSGSRINSGADDAAGLAIADGLQANITALTQSARNANDGVGELQVADGSLAQVTTLLNRAITLATEAATGTVSDPQRIALDDEYTAIKAEIDRVGSKTNYNGGQVFTANTLNVFLSDAGATSNSTIGVTTGTLSSAGLSLGGAVAATGTLTQTAGSAAVAATDTLTGGAFTSAVAASTTLTSAGTGPADGDLITIGGTAYKFVTTLTGVANEVAIGGSTAQAYLNLQAAVNAAPGGAGTAYGTGTVANANVYVSGVTGTTVTFTANLNGTAGNSITSVSSVVGDGTFTGATLAGGVAGDTVAVGGKTYTFVSALSHTATANEVISSSEATGLTNLASGVNGGPGSGTTYSASTAQNANVTAGVATTTTLLFTAINPGAAGNFITGVAAGHGSVGGQCADAGTGVKSTIGGDAGGIVRGCALGHDDNDEIADVSRFVVGSEIGKSAIVGPQTSRRGRVQVGTLLLHPLDVCVQRLPLDGLRLRIFCQNTSHQRQNGKNDRSSIPQHDSLLTDHRLARSNPTPTTAALNTR